MRYFKTDRQKDNLYRVGNDGKVQFINRIVLQWTDSACYFDEGALVSRGNAKNATQDDLKEWLD